MHNKLSSYLIPSALVHSSNLFSSFTTPYNKMSSYISLQQAARNGRIDLLANLLIESPSILADFRLTSLEESILHVATKSGQLNFVHELMKIDPNLATEPNKDGFRPLDVAVIMGHFGIVEEILSFNRDLCLLEGKDRRTALHYAAIKGRVDVIGLLLRFCPDAIRDATVYDETVLHLAVKNHQVDAFTALLKWVENVNAESIVNTSDGDGNTVLHIAVLTKQYECIDLLLSESSTIRATIQVNAKNAGGSTPLDLLSTQDSYDVKIRSKLESAGAVGSPDSTSMITPKTTKNNPKLKNDPPKNWFKYFKFQMERDSPAETRNALLVVAALIATVCFQAGVEPPEGIVDKRPPPPPPPPLPPPPPPNAPRYNPVGGSALAAAAAIFGSHAPSFLFLFANSLGLNSSICIIIYLTTGFPFQRELHIALYSMMFTYGFAFSAILKGLDAEKKVVAYTLEAIAFALPFVQRWLPRWGKKAWRYWRERRDRRKTPLPIEI